VTAALLALLLLCGADGQSPSSVKDSQAGSIRGRITAADTGKPLRRARVDLRPARDDNMTRPVIATTNSRGEFELSAVRPGWYFVTASRPGYVTVGFGQRRAGERGQAVEVRAGQPTDRIDIALPRGSVLSGSVVDELGQPYPGVRVDALALRYSEGKRQRSIVGGATTDDLGQFRISGLPPGNYFVSATSTETWRNEKKETIGYPTTYYPGSGADRAISITVGASHVVSDLSIALQASRTATISGRVVREGGEPMPGAGVTIAYSYPGGVIMSAGMRSMRAAADGSFQIKDVPGGVYNVMSGGDAAELTISGVDVDEVVLTQRTGSTLSGTVVTDDGGVPPFPVSGVRVLIETSSDKVLPTVRVVQVNDDWSFKLEGLGGPFLFRLTGLPDDWMMAAATLDERNIADDPFDVPTGGKQIAGAKIVVTRRIGRVTGTVVDENGRPTGSAAVIVFSDDPSRWTPYSRFIRATRPGPDGRFAIGPLPPGMYRAVALEFVEEGQEQDAAFLAGLRDTARTFSLGEGGTETLSLTLRGVR
jgi:hypothetical protein